jgi:hypothetical protein
MAEELITRKLREGINQIAVDATAYFGRARSVLLDVPRLNRDHYSWEKLERDHFWNSLTASLNLFGPMPLTL